MPVTHDYRYAELTRKLVEAVPELSGWCEALLRDWGEDAPGQHIVYGDLLTPYMRVLLDSGESGEATKRVFGFLEELANHEEERVQEVASVSVLEHLAGRGYLGPAWPYMLETTRRFALNIVMWHPSQHSSLAADEYDQRWREELEKRGGPLNVTLREMLALRDELATQHGLVFRAAVKTYDPFQRVDMNRFNQRFREELAKLDGIQRGSVWLPKVRDVDELYHWISQISEIREKLLEELGASG